MSKKYKYHYFYKITNLINNHFYYGVHNTNNIEDGYMGSGKRLQYAIKKYGIENFEKEILKYFDTMDEAFEYESEIVTEELVKDQNCYNQKLGGDFSWSLLRNTITAIDNNGNTFRIHKDDPRWVSGELKGVTVGKVNATDINGNHFFVDKNDIRFQTGELTHLHKNKFQAKDKNNNIYFITKDDPRWVSGELAGLAKGKKATDETRLKMKESWKIRIKNINHVKTRYVYNENGYIKICNEDLQKYLDNGYKIGKFEKKKKIIKNQKIYEAHQLKHYQAAEKNSQFGTCWIHNNKESIKIKKEQLEEYISNGWIKGRKMKF